MTNAGGGGGDQPARRARMCGRIRPGGTKAISRPNPNTATTFLSENDKKDQRSDGNEGVNDKNQRS